MKRVLALAVLAGGLAVTAVPAQAAPLCGQLAGLNCWDGSHYCRVYVAPRTCIHTA